MLVYTFSSFCIITLGVPVAKEKKAKHKKNSQLIIRLNKDEKDDFLDLCDELDTSAAREVRRFIRDFINENEADEPKD